MLPALELFKKICNFESEKSISIQNFVKPTKKLLDASTSLNVVSLKKSTASGFHLKLKDPTRSYRINLEEDCPCQDCTNCSCVNFLDRGICKHLLYVCKNQNYDLPGTENKIKLSLRTRRGRPKKASKALDYD